MCSEHMYVYDCVTVLSVFAVYMYMYISLVHAVLALFPCAQKNHACTVWHTCIHCTHIIQSDSANNEGQKVQCHVHVSSMTWYMYIRMRPKVQTNVHVHACINEQLYHFEEDPDQLLALPTVLGGEGGGGDIEEGSTTLGSHCLGQQRLPSTRRTHHQHPLEGEQGVRGEEERGKVKESEEILA